jgi:hypothetical protein
MLLNVLCLSGHLPFTEQTYWTSKSPGTWHHFFGPAVPRVSNDCTAFAFKEEAVFLACLTFGDECTTLLEHNRNYLASAQCNISEDLDLSATLLWEPQISHQTNRFVTLSTPSYPF